MVGVSYLHLHGEMKQVSSRSKLPSEFFPLTCIEDVESYMSPLRPQTSSPFLQESAVLSRALFGVSAQLLLDMCGDHTLPNDASLGCVSQINPSDHFKKNMWGWRHGCRLTVAA